MKELHGIPLNMHTQSNVLKRVRYGLISPARVGRRDTLLLTIDFA